MALKTVAFTVTCNSEGYGISDKTLPIPNGRYGARVLALEIGRSACFMGSVSVTLNERDYSSTDDTYTLGRQLAHVGPTALRQYGNDGDIFQVRADALTNVGTTPTGETTEGYPIIKSKYLRCEVNDGGATPDVTKIAQRVTTPDVVTVTVYYESTGDFRF
jgi:hypothetical protein